MSAAQIVLADMSMSIDNILAVADPIREISIVVVAGLAVAIAIAGVAAVTIARFIRATRFASPVGLVVYVLLALELYTAFELLYRGGHDVLLHPSLKDAIERMSGAQSP